MIAIPLSEGCHEKFCTFGFLKARQTAGPIEGLFQFQCSYHPGNIRNIPRRQWLKRSRQTIRVSQPKHACGGGNNPDTSSMFTEKRPQRLKAGYQGRDALMLVRRRGLSDLFRRLREQTAAHGVPDFAAGV